MDLIIAENLKILKDWYGQTKILINQIYKNSTFYNFTEHLDIYDSLLLYTFLLVTTLWVLKKFRL